MIGRLLATALLAIALTGCGGGDEGKVEDTVEGYLSALADGDGDEACDRFTGEIKRSVADAIGASSCADAIETLSDNLDDDEKDKLKDAEVVDIKVNDIKRECSKRIEGLCRGPTATARVEGGDSEVELAESEDGDWLISGGFDF